MAIDFMAYARGQRTALDNMLQEERLLRERSEREREWEKQLLDRQAASYLSTSTTNQQLAADAGVSPIDYMIQQREQTLADPNFQRMPPALQQAIMEQMRGQAVLMAQNAYNQGNMADANRLVSAYGNLPLASQFQTAGLSGNVAQIVQAMNEQFGTNAVLSEDGQSVTVNGTTMPAAEFARQAWASGSGSGGLTALAAWQEAQRLEQARQEEYAQALRLAGIDPASVGLGAAGAAPAAPGAAPAAPGVPETQNERLDRILREQRDAVMQAQGLQQGADGQWYQPGDPRLSAAAAPASVADVARAAAEQEILGARARQDAVRASPEAWATDFQRFANLTRSVPGAGPALSAAAGLLNSMAGPPVEPRQPIGRYAAMQGRAPGGGPTALETIASSIQSPAQTAQQLRQVASQVEQAIQQLYAQAGPALARTGLEGQLRQNRALQSRPGLSAAEKASLRREEARLRAQLEEVQDGS